MIPFHTVLLDLAQREVSCVHVAEQDPVLPPDDYIFMEYYCEDLNCDCRRLFAGGFTKPTVQGLRQHRLRLGERALLPSQNAVGTGAGHWDGSRGTGPDERAVGVCRGFFWICSKRWCWMSRTGCGCAGITGCSGRSWPGARRMTSAGSPALNVESSAKVANERENRS